MSSPTEDGEVNRRWRTPATPPKLQGEHSRDYAALQTRLRHSYLFTPLRESRNSNNSNTSSSTNTSNSTSSNMSHNDRKPALAHHQPAPASRNVAFRRIPQGPGHHYHGGAPPTRPGAFPINLQGTVDGRGTSIKYHTFPRQSVEQLKRWLHYKFGYGLEELRLVYDGRILHDWDTMEQLGLEAGDFVDIYLEQVGG